MGGIGSAFRLLPVRIRPSASVAGRSASTRDVVWARGLPLRRHGLNATRHWILSSVERAAFGAGGCGCRSVVFGVVWSGNGAVRGLSAMGAEAAVCGANDEAAGGARGGGQRQPIAAAARCCRSGQAANGRRGIPCCGSGPRPHRACSPVALVAGTAAFRGTGRLT